MDYVSSDEIIATKGDLIAFRRFFLWFFLRLFVPSKFINYRPWQWLVYCHFAVCTESASVSGEIIPEEICKRITIGVDTPKWFTWFGIRLPFSVTKLVEKTMQTLCDQHGCRVNNHDEFARQKKLVINTPDDVVKRAREFLRDNQHPIMFYNVLIKNCEHFATLCRYEKAFSLQVPGWISKTFDFIFMLCSMLCSMLCWFFYKFFKSPPGVDNTSVIVKEVSANEQRNNNMPIEEL